MKPSRYETLAIGLGWLLSLLAGWLATRPGLELLHSLGSSEAAAFDAGGLELLELARVEQPSALAAARRGIQWLAGATLLSLLPRALLCRAVMSEPASWGSWLRESLLLLPRFVVQRLVLLCGGAVLVGLGLWFIDSQATLVGWVEGAPLLFAALAFCLAQPFAALVDGWNLTLARDARLIAGARAAYQLVGDRRSWWMRAGKSVAVGVLAALGLGVTPGPVGATPLDGVLRTLATATLGLGMVALDWAYYRWLSARLPEPAPAAEPVPEGGRSKLSEASPTPDDTAAGDDAPADPTPHPGA